jgi:hypothetical protein
MEKATTGTTMRLLDLLEAHEGWDLIDGGEVWSVREWAAEWQAGAGEEDRGPVVAVCDGEDGRRAVVALDEDGRPAELVGVLAWEA